MDKQEELMGIERSLWTNDAAICEATYSPDAILIFPEVGRIGLELATRGDPGRERCGSTLGGSRICGRLRDEDRVRCGAFHLRGDSALERREESGRTLCATLYARRGDTWRVLFHQQTSV
jgi:hypothetical protein